MSNDNWTLPLLHVCVCCRCVLMVGMPYPNINSPELKEKMDYLNANFVRYTHYLNVCGSYVNQSLILTNLLKLFPINTLPISFQ